MDKEVVETLELKEPIVQGSVTITVLEFRKLKAKHFKGMRVSQNEVLYDDYFTLLKRLCDQPESIIGELGLEDMLNAIKVTRRFLPASLATGSQP